MKRICFLAVCSLLTSSAFAAVTGPYVGLGAGYGNLRTPKGYAYNTANPNLTANSSQHGGWAGRAFGGYNFNRFIGLEAGWAYYPRSVYKASDTFGDNSQLQYNVKAVDAEVKAYLPIGYTGLNVYALLGAAYVTETIDNNYDGIPTAPSFNFPSTVGTNHVYRTRPLYGIGASYDFPCHISTEVEFTQIQRLGNFENNGNSVPFINLATLDLIYRFM